MPLSLDAYLLFLHRKNIPGVTSLLLMTVAVTTISSPRESTTTSSFPTPTKGLSISWRDPYPSSPKPATSRPAKEMPLRAEGPVIVLATASLALQAFTQVESPARAGQLAVDEAVGVRPGTDGGVPTTVSEEKGSEREIIVAGGGRPA